MTVPINVTIVIDTAPPPSPLFRAEFDDGFAIMVDRGDEEHGDAGLFVAYDDSGVHEEFTTLSAAIEYAMQNVRGAIDGILCPVAVLTARERRPAGRRRR